MKSAFQNSGNDNASSLSIIDSQSLHSRRARIDVRLTPARKKTIATQRTKLGGNRLAILLLSGCSLTVAGLFLMLAFGQVYGTEFSPLSFKRRSYMFFEVPFVHWQVTPTWRDDDDNSLQQTLQRRQFLPTTGQTDRWDVAWVVESAERREADPLILTRYLDMQRRDWKVSNGGPALRWEDWTAKNPGLAAVFWPVVQRAAWLDAYVLVPDLFERAETATDATDLRRTLDAFMTTSLKQIADDRSAQPSPRG